jgi:RNA polymerase sporulation-specific sigma factor
MAAENPNSRCTVEADLELLSRYQDGDEDALDDLLKSHYRLIRFWVRKVLAVVISANREDVLQEARIGFFTAAREFKVPENGDFHTHARNRIKKAVYDSRAVRRRVKRTLWKNYDAVIQAQDRLLLKLNRAPALEELAEEAKLTVRQVDTALNVIAAFPFPLEEADEHFTIEDPYQTHLIRDSLNKLDWADAHIIIRRYFYGQTDPEIAENLGLSTGAVKMRRRRAEKKLRDIMSAEGDRKDGTT